MAHRSKIKVAVNNKLKKGVGATSFDKNNKPIAVEINVKKHKGDKRELASTIKHELLHVKHPKMTEKEVYKKSAKTKISPMEQSKLLAKVRTKAIHQKEGAIKRKFKMGNVKTNPGDLITKMNEQKGSITRNKKSLSKQQVAIWGMI